MKISTIDTSESDPVTPIPASEIQIVANCRLAATAIYRRDPRLNERDFRLQVVMLSRNDPGA